MELQQIALDVLSKRCKALEAQAQQLTESNEQMAPQAKYAGKSERRVHTTYTPYNIFINTRITRILL